MKITFTGGTALLIELVMLAWICVGIVALLLAAVYVFLLLSSGLQIYLEKLLAKRHFQRLFWRFFIIQIKREARQCQLRRNHYKNYM